MAQQTFWDIFRKWLRHRRKIAILFGTAFAVLFFVYGLYGLPWGPAIYAGLLWGMILFITGLYDFFVFARKLNLLKKLSGQALPSEIPSSNDPLEQAYVTLLEKVQRDLTTATGQMQQKLVHAQRYYTLWSHQIKTPMAAVRLLLQEEELETGAIMGELYKMEQYVEMALQYQRLSGTSRDLVLREYFLDDLVRQAVRRVATLFIHKHLLLHLEPLNLHVLTDEKWLVFILEQLLTNAVKYTPTGSVSIFLSQKTPETLIISDTGIGIRAEDLPRVFDWGYTGYNGRMEQHSTGIGLSLCRQATEMLGHRLTLESTLGTGTRAVLFLERNLLEPE